MGRKLHILLGIINFLTVIQIDKFIDLLSIDPNFDIFLKESIKHNTISLRIPFLIDNR